MGISNCRYGVFINVVNQCAKLAKFLNTEGYRTKTRTSKNGRASGGGYFTADTVYRVLCNPIYTGKICYGDEEFAGIHTPIIDEELFNLVQSRLAEVQRNPNETYESQTPLTLLGITRCGHCGHQLTSTSTKKSSGKKYYYYKCTTASKIGKDRCASKDIKADDLESFVSRLIEHMGSDDDFLEAAYSRMEHNGEEELREARERLARLNGNRAAIMKDLNVYVDAIRHTNLKESTSIAQKLAELEKMKTDVEGQLRLTNIVIEREETKTISMADLKRAFQHFAEVYGSLSIEKKREFNRGFFLEINSYMKRGDKDGEMEFKFRADGSLRVNWGDIKKPQVASSLLGGLPLRG